MLVAMSSSLSSNGSHCSNHDIELRRGPWTAEEDNLLVHYIACHGEGRWSMVANRSGLRRTGKSCRLRWLNYLKPDLKHGNLSPEEQLLILKLHIKLGNRWSKIAKYLPGRTDNEIKNYWRTKVEKQARHLKIASNSMDFQQMIRCLWIPRLLQKIQRSQKESLPKESLQSAISVHESAATNNPGNGSPKIIESAKALDHHHHQINSTENNSSIESAKINQVLHISDTSENLFDATSTEIDYNPFEGYNFDSISYDMRLCSPEHFTETSNFCKDFSDYGLPGKDNYYYL